MFRFFDPVDFEWDDSKAASNEAKHGVAFSYAIRVFLDDRRLDAEDARRNYGETRWSVIGAVEGLCLHVTYAERGGCARIISARKAHRKERIRYGDHARNA